MSVVGDAVGSIFGNKTSGEKAAEEAAKIQAEAIKGSSELQSQSIDKAIAEQQRQYDINKQTLDPYNQGGQAAFQKQQALSGLLGPEAQKAAYAEFESSPGQDYLRSEAEKTLLRQAASTGNLGGAALKAALQKQAIGLAQQNYQQQFQNLGSLTNTGLSAAGGEVNAGSQSANNISNLMTNQGAVQGGGLTGAAEARASGILTGQQSNVANQQFLIGTAASILGGESGKKK